MVIVRFSEAARSDIRAILLHTHEHFGSQARNRYESLLAIAFRDLSQDPARVGSVDRTEIGPGIRSFHLRHSRQRARDPSGVVHRPRHFILYRNIRPSIIGIGRVLHEAMDVQRHLPISYGDEDG